jgi:hypothetical protein
LAAGAARYCRRAGIFPSENQFITQRSGQISRRQYAGLQEIMKPGLDKT